MSVAAEERKIGKLESQFLKHRRRNLVCVCEDMNFLWDEDELIEVAEMWKDGNSVWKIAERFDRDPDEILVALVHLARERKIKDRPRGIR